MGKKTETKGKKGKIETPNNALNMWYKIITINNIQNKKVLWPLAKGLKWWSVGDSNSRPLPCEGSALNQLS